MANQYRVSDEETNTKIDNHPNFPKSVLISLGRPFFYLTLYLVYFSLLTISPILKRVVRPSDNLLSFKTNIRSKSKTTENDVRKGNQRNLVKDASHAHKKEGIIAKDDDATDDFVLIQKTLPSINPPAYRRMSVLKFGLISFSTLSVIGLLLGYSVIFDDLPSAKELTTRNSQVSTKIYDRNGILLYTIYKDENRTPVKLEDIPKHAVMATLAIEDAEFYNHQGFSIRGISRALIKNYRQNTLYGGSTITQQLVKNTLLSSEKTLARKLKELVLALQVEYYFEKDEILEMYLNEVSYGGTAYGIQEASQMYFGKNANELNLAESALLAGLPKSPTRYSPFGHNSEYSKGRQEEVLKLMTINGYITEEQRQEALKVQVKFAPNKIDIRAPHFVMFVRDELEKTYGKEVVEKGGLKVTTTLDEEIQLLVERVVSEEIEPLKSLNVTNAAAIVLDPKNGEILAMVGSKDYFDTPNDGNVNTTLSLRQPGSSIKVVTYAYALGNGMSAASVVADSPISYKVAGQPDYVPQNYDGAYRGNLTIRSALAESRNIPAVKVMEKYGVDNIIDLGKKMGITTWEDESRFGLSLTLGGGEVKLIDLARVYATLANGGQSPKVKYVKSVVNYSEKTLENDNCLTQSSSTLLTKSSEVLANYDKVAIFEEDVSNCESVQVLDERVAFILTDILRDNTARTPSFGSRSTLVIPNHPEVAVKTGTSNNLRDNLTVGYNQDYVVAVWVGNNDNTPMSRIASGVTGASPIFNKIMSSLLSGKEPTQWDIPEGVVQLPICTYTGTLACAGCPVVNEWFLEESKPTQICKPEWFMNDDKSRVEGRILPEAASVTDWSQFRRQDARYQEDID